ncbi:hypothetical protein HDU91_001646 [Kappamyces sp. JEL0680]|nr:hypothetical protein HDU91_001646 [Kappamyces sp. JEL0680]
MYKASQLPPTHFQSNLGKTVAELQEKLAETDSFEQYAADFLKSIDDDESLYHFKSEYLKILHVIRRSKSNSVSLVQKGNELVAEIAANDHNPIDMSKLTNDILTLKTLKTQISRAESMLAASLRREESAKDDLRLLRQDVGNLNTTIKQGVTLSAAQEKAINELISLKEQTTKDLEAELDKIVNLRNGLSSISEKIEGMEQDRKSIDKEIYALKEKNAAKKLEIDMELANKEKLERDLRELRVIVTIKSQEAVSKQNAVNRATEDITVIDNQIKQQKLQIEKLLRDQESLGTRTVKLQHDYDEQMTLTTELMQENEIAFAELKIKEKELHNHKAEVKKVSRIKEALVKKSRALEETKLQEENERKVYRTYNDNLLATIDQRKRSVDSIKKSIDDLSRERDILKGSLKKTQEESSRLSSLLILQKQQQVSFEMDIARISRELIENERERASIEAERNTLEDELASLASQSIKLLSELKDQELHIFDYKRQAIQAENKLKYQQNLYDAVQSDRKLHSKQLIESQAEIAEMKRKLKIMNFQINGFKDDVNAKNATLARDSEALVKLSKDSELIKDEIKTLKSQNELAQAYIKTQMVEEFKLDQFVKEAEVERARQQTALDLIVTERDHLSSQLLRRNQELTDVYNKIKTQNLALLRGESHYRSKLKVIQGLREKIVSYRIQAAELHSETESIPTLKKSIVKLQNQVIQAQTRIKALEEELENPINVHRWRKLEGSQPQVYSMLQLLHTLQKKLIAKTKEEREKEASIEVKEKLYLHLKTILAKQAGPEAVQQVAELHKIAKEKKMQLRHMDTELNMYKSQVNEYQYAIQGLDANLSDCKKRFLKMYQERVRQAKETNFQMPHASTVSHAKTVRLEEPSAPSSVEGSAGLEDASLQPDDNPDDADPETAESQQEAESDRGESPGTQEADE